MGSTSRVWLALLAVSALAAACSKKPDPAREAELRAMREEVTEAARAVEARSFARTPRRSPALPGSFGELFDARSAERAAMSEATELVTPCLMSLDAGTDDRCAADLAPTKTALDALLDLTRAERGGAQSAFHPFAPLSAPERSFLALCRRATAEVRLATRAGRTDDALETCTRALEAARDDALGANLVGGMLAAGCVERIAPACEATGAPRGSPAIRAVAESWPPFTDFVDAELGRISLERCAALLTDEDRGKLGPRGQAALTRAQDAAKALPRREVGIYEELCVTGARSDALVRRAFRAARGSDERKSLLEQARKATPVASVELEKYEEKWEETRAILKRLATP